METGGDHRDWGDHRDHRDHRDLETIIETGVDQTRGDQTRGNQTEGDHRDYWRPYRLGETSRNHRD